MRSTRKTEEGTWNSNEFNLLASSQTSSVRLSQLRLQFYISQLHLTRPFLFFCLVYLSGHKGSHGGTANVLWPCATPIKALVVSNG